MREYLSMGVALVAFAGVASAYTVTYRDTLSVPFTSGSGNSNTNFSVARDTNTGVEVGIKAKERWFGDGNVGGTGALYIVQAGYSPISNSNPTPDAPRGWWNFDISIVLGSLTFATTSVTLDIVNNINSMSTSIDISALMVSNGFGALSAVQDSQNLGFAGLAALVGYNANQTGTYDFTLTERFGGVVGAQTTMRVQVGDQPIIPLPHAAGLGFAGLLGLGAMRRRR